jgi:predicted GNAT family N-acyltransferase
VAELVTAELLDARQKRLLRVIPVFRLGRLARDLRQKGAGLGELLLFDAIDRISKAAQVVDAKAAAVEFYLAYGFEQMLDHPLKLFLAY